MIGISIELLTQITYLLGLNDTPELRQQFNSSPMRMCAFMLSRGEADVSADISADVSAVDALINHLNSLRRGAPPNGARLFPMNVDPIADEMSLTMFRKARTACQNILPVFIMGGDLIKYNEASLKYTEAIANHVKGLLDIEVRKLI